jgi:hypothetical protein
MLDKLSDEDIQRIIESLQLKGKSEAKNDLTEEKFNRRTTYKVEGETLILPDGWW